MSFGRSAIVLAAGLALAACQGFGPTTVPRDRMGYAGAIAASWQDLMLVNIVKTRYLDLPVYLDVSSVVSSYELSAQANVSANVFPNASAANNRSFGASGTYSEWPTVSYAPLSGERLVNMLLRPIPPETVFAMISGGRRTEFILAATVRSINGVYGTSTTSPGARRADPRFGQLAQAIGRLEQAGALGVHPAKRDDKVVYSIVFYRGVGAETDTEIRLVKQLLELEPGKDEFPLASGAGHRRDEIAVNTRSIQQLLGELATGVDVPEEDLRRGRATPRARVDAETPRLISARSGDTPPADAYAAVPYRGHWFWIDDDDLASKRMFVFLMMFMSLAESGAVPQAPLLTIPLR
jgi:hypothetical protein